MITDIDIYDYFKTYNKLYNIFTFYFDELLKLEEKDKLLFKTFNNISYSDVKIINYNRLNFSMHVDKYNIFQPIKRYINNYSRKYMILYLNILFDEYEKVLLNINNNSKDNYYLNQIKFRYKNYNKKIVAALDILKKTYNDYYIDTIINKYINIIL